MRYLLLISLFIFSVYGLDYGNITCWDICRKRCKARNGWITDQCVKSCGCPCDTQCDNTCTKFGLGTLCRFKCGCFQNYTFGYIRNTPLSNL